MTRSERQQTPIALAALVGLVVMAGTAHADSAVEARFFDARARAAFARHDYRHALDDFLQSHLAAPSPGSAYNVGVCAMLAGDDALAFAMLSDVDESAMRDAARLEDARARLARLRPRLALVRVESDPPGATIEVDRAELGAFGITPRTLALTPGPHTLRVRTTGRVTASAAVEAVRGSEASVSLALAPETGTLSIQATPEAARVVVLDGSGVAIAEGRGSITLPVGVVRVHAELADHVPSDVLATITAGQDTALTIALEPVPVARGRLLCSTAGVPARVTIDAQPAGPTPLGLALREGPHRVRVEAEGHRPWESDVVITAGRSTYLDLLLVPDDH